MDKIPTELVSTSISRGKDVDSPVISGGIKVKCVVVTEARFPRRSMTSGLSHEDDPASEQLTVTNQGEHRGVEVRFRAAGGLANIGPNSIIGPEGWKDS